MVSPAALVAVSVLIVLAPCSVHLRRRFGIALRPQGRLILAATLVGAAGLVLTLVEVSSTDLGLAYVSPWWFLLTSVTTAVALIGLDVASTRLLLAIPGAVGRTADVRELFPRSTSFENAYLIGTLVLMAVYEEILFRGLLYHIGELNDVPMPGVILGSALLFALQHAAVPSAVPYAWFYGVAYGTAYLLSGSLYPVIAAHLAGNLFTVYWVWPRLEAATGVEPRPRLPF